MVNRQDHEGLCAVSEVLTRALKRQERLQKRTCVHVHLMSHSLRCLFGNEEGISLAEAIGSLVVLEGREREIAVVQAGSDSNLAKAF